MAKKQYRRSISVTAESYATATLTAAARGMSVSALVEALLTGAAQASNVTPVTRDDARAAKQAAREEAVADGSTHFSF